jgi:hypothetical protein
VQYADIMRWYDWQRSGLQPGPPYDRCSPNLSLLVPYMRQMFGGQSLGCYNKRPVTGGTSWSTHAFGAASDLGIGERHGGPGVAGAEAQVLPWLTTNWEKLGVQQVHAYWRTTNRMWRCDRGWFNGNPGKGQDWIHIEVSNESWWWDTPIAERLREVQVIRVAGDNRYHTAALLSVLNFPQGADTVYVVSGTTFPDALALGPTVVGKGPILLTDKDRLPVETEQEIKRLRPSQIVIVGGPSVVSPAVEETLRRLQR